jgi:hypothetical protein
MDGIMNKKYFQGILLRKIGEKSIWQPDEVGRWANRYRCQREDRAVGLMPPQGVLEIPRRWREFLASSTDKADGIPKDY